MNSNIWKWEQMRKTIREKQRLREPLNQAGICAVKGNQDAVGVCAPVPSAKLIVFCCKCHLQTAHNSPLPGQLSHPAASELCSYMILMTSVNGWHVNWYDHGHFPQHVTSLPEFEIISISFFWGNLTQWGFWGKWGGILVKNSSKWLKINPKPEKEDSPLFCHMSLYDVNWLRSLIWNKHTHFIIRKVTKKL